jgi:putative Ig domain-containing protein
MSASARRALFIGVSLTIAFALALSATPQTAAAWGSASPTPTRTATPRPPTPTPTKTATPKPPTPTPTKTPSPTPTSAGEPLTITTTTLNNGNVGASYNEFVLSSGGSGSPDTFRVIAGSLPNGLTMATDFGVQSTLISGTPTTVQTRTFTVEVRDPAGNVDTQVLTITIDGPQTLAITNQSSQLVSGTVGSAYQANLFRSGGVAPYTWSIISGSLPPGLRLSGNIISGTPTTSGTFAFRVRLADGSGQQVTRDFTIAVN